MSKMIRPEMSVVRFKEADVIVASTGTMKASGWGDGIDGNLKITYDGNDYTYSNRNDLTTALTNNNQTDTVHTSTGKDYTFNNLFGGDHNNDNYTSVINGFTWDSENNRWNTHQ